MTSSLPSQFHPLVARWFAQTFEAPTAIQAQAWQAVAGGGHVLISAPTGSGKTLAAFLWALDRLICGQWEGGCSRVVYVSPLKALNNDIRRNLDAPLQALRRLFAQEGRPFPRIGVAVRSGDTSPAERRRMLRQPPEILITTPESLNLLLSAAGGRSTLNAVKTVILDEVHAILGTRRGTYLMTAVERLTRLSGEFQRIALSATVRPMETAGRFVGGYRMAGTDAQPRYIPRPVGLITDETVKSYALAVRQPDAQEQPGDPKAFWSPYAERIKARALANHATLVFTNSRQLSEKLTLLLNSGESELLAYAHHGALSREIRTAVEQNLKAGNLKAIVATGSLELGIDIGDLDEVILVQSPASVAEAVQRIGRTGHGVGETSRGTFYPGHPMDIVTAAVLAEAVGRGDIEATQPMAAPLDVLVQVIVSMCAFETWHPASLYNFLRTAQPYHGLSRRQFDLVLDLLEGRYQQTRLRELQARIRFDRLDRTVSTRRGALLTLYTSGGVIPDRGYFRLRQADSGARIGELDEEFVWEARVGQVFTLGTQNWRIQTITSSDVLVVPAPSGKPAPPFWRAENSGRGFHLADKIARFMESAEADLGNPSFDQRMRQTHHLDDVALENLKVFLRRQRKRTGCALPHRHHLVIEYTTLGHGGRVGNQVVWHTLWGGRVNRPLAVALEAAWEEAYGDAPQIFTSNDSLSFVLPHEVPAEALIGLVRTGRLEELIHRRLASTGYFGARFRECAGRALLLPRQGFNQRMPLWLSRLRAHKLLSAVAGYPDFPILAETWRTCLQDEFDLPALKSLLGELEQGRITWSAVRTAYPSPLAQNSAWTPINTAMYQNDQGAPSRSASLTDDLLFEITLDPELRPKIDPRAAIDFERKRQRLAAGYSPDSPEELLEWVKERVALPDSEWGMLQAAMVRDHGPQAREFADRIAAKLVRLHPVDAGHRADAGLILARQVLPRWLAALHGDASVSVAVTLLTGDSLDGESLEGPADVEDDDSVSPGAVLLAEWLRFYGPRSAEAVPGMLGIGPSQWQTICDELTAARLMINGRLMQPGDSAEVCDRENFEILLRLARRQKAPTVEALDIQALPLFLAQYQGLTQPGRTIEDLGRRLEQLLGWPAPAGLWETDLLPARLAGYRTDWMDQLIQEGELLWLGAAGRQVLFCYANELDLIRSEGPGEESPGADEESTGTDDCADLFPDPHGRYPFAVLERNSGLTAADLNHRLWAAVWQGRVSNDTFAALRRGIENRFKMPPDGPSRPGASNRARPGRRLPRSGFQRWRAARPGIGNWYALRPTELSADPLGREERHKERLRLLLDRYGIIFRELLSRELPTLQWRVLFRALRLMELSGEVTAGQFFEGIQGPQFVSAQALDALRQDLPRDAVYWLNALDPTSLCGLGLDALRSLLPRRLPGCHLVYHGVDLVVVSRKMGKILQIMVPADHPRLTEYLDFLRQQMTRPVRAVRRLRIETINNEPANAQPDYLSVLEQCFEVAADPKGLDLYLRHPAQHRN